MWTTVVYVLATLAMVLIFAGLAMARDRRRHVPLMLAAFALDMIGLVIVEFVVPAVEGRTDPVRGLMEGGDEGVPMIHIVHAIFATLSVVGYIVQIVSGKKLMRGEMDKLASHKRWAWMFLATRLAAYVTMWMV